MVPDRKGAEAMYARIRNLLTRILAVIRERVWPGIKSWIWAVYRLMRQRVLPAVGSGSKRVKGELVRIHHQQNWVQRCSTTLAGNAAGLAMAMLSTKLVASMVETREASNLWGVLADHPVVSERTYEVLSFGVEYLLGLIVFTITEFYIAEYRRKQVGEESMIAGNDDRSGE